MKQVHTAIQLHTEQVDKCAATIRKTRTDMEEMDTAIDSYDNEVEEFAATIRRARLEIGESCKDLSRSIDRLRAEMNALTTELAQFGTYLKGGRRAFVRDQQRMREVPSGNPR
jgi:uncharacterized coiled-coil DUF342 family protein